MVKQVTPTATLAAPAPAEAAPAVEHGHEHGARVLLQPGFAFIVALFAAVGWSMHSLAVDSGGSTTSMPVFVAVFTLAALVLVSVHEAGHVLAAQSFGHRLLRVRLGSKFGVTMLGDHTRRSTVISAAAGPAVGTAAALLVLAVTPMWSAIWMAAVFALIENVGNVALFFLPGSDGSKIVTALRRPAPEVVPA